MKITADFYTPDEADRAAGIIKAKVPNALDVTVSGYARRSFPQKIFSSPLSPDEKREESEKRGSYRTRVICRNEDSAHISQILVNSGGHNFTRTM